MKYSEHLNISIADKKMTQILKTCINNICSDNIFFRITMIKKDKKICPIENESEKSKKLTLFLPHRVPSVYEKIEIILKTDTFLFKHRRINSKTIRNSEFFFNKESSIGLVISKTIKSLKNQN